MPCLIPPNSARDAAVKAYQKALDDTSVSDTIRAIIAQQFEHIRQSHDTVRGFVQSSAK